VIVPLIEQEPHFRAMRCTLMIRGITRSLKAHASTRLFSLVACVSEPFVDHLIA
jgi:hypothetical protein